MIASTFVAPMAAACASLFLLAPATVLAQQVSAEDRGRIEARISELSSLVAAGDFGAALDMIPPRLKAVVLAEVGIAEADLKREMNRSWGTLLQEEGLTLAGFDLNADQAVEGMTSDGKHLWLTIPTETHLKVEDYGSFTIRTQTLAVKDEGEWYLIRMDKPEQTELLVRAYPGFEGMSFAPSQIVVD